MKLYAQLQSAIEGRGTKRRLRRLLRQWERQGVALEDARKAVTRLIGSDTLAEGMSKAGYFGTRLLIALDSGRYDLAEPGRTPNGGRLRASMVASLLTAVVALATLGAAIAAGPGGAGGLAWPLRYASYGVAAVVAAICGGTIWSRSGGRLLNCVLVAVAGPLLAGGLAWGAHATGVRLIGPAIAFYLPALGLVISLIVPAIRGQYRTMERIPGAYGAWQETHRRAYYRFGLYGRPVAVTTAFICLEPVLTASLQLV